MSEYIKSIFATPLLIGQARDSEVVCEEITNLAYDLRANLKEGSLVSDGWDRGARSTRQEDFAKSGVTSFNSTSDLFNDPKWVNITKFIYGFAETMIHDVDPDKSKFFIINMWTTIYPTGAFVPEHIHSNAYLSGVFYAKAPPDCGDIVFHDPAWIAKTMQLRSTAKASFPAILTKQGITPEAGKMILFPAWLPHRSMPNNSPDDRIIVSFNIGFDDVLTDA
jgi:uncharacterized protein (TIGR02466 family)